MLARPEFGTREHILMWLADQEPDATFHWWSYTECACGRYARETAGMSNIAWVSFAMTPGGEALGDLNHMAHACSSYVFGSGTYGDLYKLARERWS